MNHIILIGRIGKDPEIRIVGDTSVTTATLATSEKYKDKQGNKQEKTTWFYLNIWGKPGETFKKYVNKGDKIAINGKMETSQYEKDGEKKVTWFVNVSGFEFLESRKSESEAHTEAPPQNNSNDDLPF